MVEYSQHLIPTAVNYEITNIVCQMLPVVDGGLAGNDQVHKAR